MLQIIELLVYDSEDIEIKFLKTIKRWRSKYKTTPIATSVKQNFIILIITGYIRLICWHYFSLLVLFLIYCMV